MVPLGAEVVDDPGGGLGAAVAAGLAGVDGHVLIVNGPSLRDSAALSALARAGLALVEADDGTTNALSLPDPSVFIPLYGPGSAGRRLRTPRSLLRRSQSFRRMSTARLTSSDSPLGWGHARGDFSPSRREDRPPLGRRRRSAPARGLADVLPAGDLTVVGNVGDDIEILGLHVSPDLDSLLYTLAGLIDEARLGSGKRELERSASAASWGADDWFRLGDRDIGLHLVRTEMLDDGVPLSSITAHLVERARVSTQIFPATDDRLRTNVHTPAGTFPFQEWFVARKHADDVEEVSYEGAPSPARAGCARDPLAAADAIILAPSNPYLSIGPTLAMREIGEALEARRVRCLAVSPLVGGKAVSGPLDRMLHGWGHDSGRSRRVLRRADRRAGHRRVGRSRTGKSRARGDEDADARPRIRSRARENGAGGGVRIAIVGGTGPFGTALAKRLRGPATPSCSAPATSPEPPWLRQSSSRRGDERGRSPRSRSRRPRHQRGCCARHRSTPARRHRLEAASVRGV